MNDERTKLWLEDIEMFEEQLPLGHTNLFFKRDKYEFYHDIEILKSNLEIYDDYEIMVQIGKIAASIKDAHTFVTFPIRRLCPLEFYWFKEGVYLTGGTSKYKRLEFNELVSINGISIEKNAESIREIVSYENQYYLKSQLPKFLPAVELLYGLEIIDEIDYLDLTFRDLLGKLKDIRVNSINISTDKDKIKKYPIKGVVPIYRTYENENYWYEYNQYKKEIYFKYNACKNTKNNDIHSFLKQLIYTIESKPVNRLIIDFRNNYGGDSTLLDGFIEEIKSIHAINKEGNLFVIVGRETFSSALLNIFSLKKNTKAIFVGEPSGGKPNCYGEVKKFNFKNSKLSISYSTKYYKLVNDDEMEYFLPDIVTELSIYDYIKGVDPCLKAIEQKYTCNY